MNEPAWMHKARQLEMAGKLKEMEECVNDHVPHLGAAATVAQLYLDRMVRLQQAGDTTGAKEAYRQSSNWIIFYASQATAGGEGVALYMERQEFLEELNRLFQGNR